MPIEATLEKAATSGCYLKVRRSGSTLSVGVVNIFPNSGGAQWKNTRGRVTEFSGGSRRRLLAYLAACTSRYTIMTTLTLPHVETDGALFKAKLDEWLTKAIRVHGNLQSESMLWFLEFQARGAPHVHVLSTFRIPKAWVSEMWAALWCARAAQVTGVEMRDANQRMLLASTRVEKLRKDATRYAAKYGAKMDQKEVPDGYRDVGRFWGIRGVRARETPEVTMVELTGKASPWNSTLVRFWIAFERLLMATKGAQGKNWSYGVGVFVFSDRTSFNMALFYAQVVALIGSTTPVAAATWFDANLEPLLDI